LFLVLVGTGLLTGAVLPAVTATVIERLVLNPIIGDATESRQTRAGVALVVVVAGALADRLRIRPLAVHRQVPSVWGHQHGPWLAALRYGPRLGLGPSTILTSWTWWTAMLAALIVSPASVIVSGAVYVVVRALMTVSVGSGVTNGVEMATRMAKVASASRQQTAVRVAQTVSAVGAVVLATMAVGI
jgi:hypothetical protein